MKNYQSIIIITLMMVMITSISYSQKVGFINSNTIREKYPDALQAQQRVQSMDDEWKRELDAMQLKIDNLEFEIRKNRLVWTDVERQNKESELGTLTRNREAYAKSIYEPNGKFDEAALMIYTPVEEKIYAAVQQVATDQGFDILIDQSVQPMPYVNYKYDMTVKVLKNLGVNVDDLEKDLAERIEKDPRNQQRESKSPRRRGRSRVQSKDDVNKEAPALDPGVEKPLDPKNNPELLRENEERRIKR